MLLSDDLPDSSGGGGGDLSRHPVDNVTHPFVTQTYRCVASYETKDAKNRPFKVALDEKLDVLIKDPAGRLLTDDLNIYKPSLNLYAHFCCAESTFYFLTRLVAGGERG